MAFLELIFDPASSVVFEAEVEEADLMQRPPRGKERLFNKRTLTMSLLQGFGVLIILLAIFEVALERRQDELNARALTFTSLVIANLALIVTNRSWSRNIFDILRTPNPDMWWVVYNVMVRLPVLQRSLDPQA